MYRKRQEIFSQKLIELVNRSLLNIFSVKTSLTNLLLLTLIKNKEKIKAFQIAVNGLYYAYSTIPVSSQVPENL
jgi:hypothetical protein